MKILVAHNRYRYRGGEDTVVDAEVDLLRRNGHEVLVYLRDNEELTRMKNHHAALQTLWSHKAVADVTALSEKFRPELIHSHNTFPLISPSLYSVATRLNVPVIQTLHNFRLICPQATLLRKGVHCEDCVGHLPWRAIVHRCYRNSLSQSAVSSSMIMLHRLLRTWHTKVTRYIVLNQLCRDKFIAGGFPFDLLRIKPNFVDSANEPEWVFRSGGIFIGRLSEEKGLKVLAEALSQLPDSQIDVYGKGDLQSYVEATSSFNYKGFHAADELQACLRQAAYLVVPSTGVESFGLVAIEAFAAGTPVIASANGGLQEIVVHGKTGFLVESGNTDALARAIAFAEDHPDEMKVMGRAARQAYLSRYTPNINYQLLMNIYCEAVESMARIPSHTLPFKRSEKIKLQKIEL
jgi:glycosyltransferase involved in cell wall biosynthesis